MLVKFLPNICQDNGRFFRCRGLFNVRTPVALTRNLGYSSHPKDQTLSPPTLRLSTERVWEEEGGGRLLPELGFEPATFRCRVRCLNHSLRHATARYSSLLGVIIMYSYVVQLHARAG